MSLEFNRKQLELLSSLFIDIAKVMFISAAAIPAISPQATANETVRALGIGLTLTYVSLKMLETK